MSLAGWESTEASVEIRVNKRKDATQAKDLSALNNALDGLHCVELNHWLVIVELKSQIMIKKHHIIMIIILLCFT